MFYKMKLRSLVLFVFALFLVLPIKAQMPFQRLDVFDLQWVDNPQISPNGEHIVYQRRWMDIMTDRRTSSLWLIDSDGSNHQKLTSYSGNESRASWSPDGSRIAFVTSAETHGAEIFVYWVETGKVAHHTARKRSRSFKLVTEWESHRFYNENRRKKPCVSSSTQKTRGCKMG